mmetsp:Transcript_99754/g.253648  ORF Transcript_99754/g.253648 Transcript_99754/m.253648 type:complete len:200 (-) Transcript_99754:1543-2142(-)
MLELQVLLHCIVPNSHELFLRRHWQFAPESRSILRGSSSSTLGARLFRPAGHQLADGTGDRPNDTSAGGARLGGTCRGPRGLFHNLCCATILILRNAILPVIIAIFFNSDIVFHQKTALRCRLSLIVLTFGVFKLCYYPAHCQLLVLFVFIALTPGAVQAMIAGWPMRDTSLVTSKLVLAIALLLRHWSHLNAIGPLNL